VTTLRRSTPVGPDTSTFIALNRVNLLDVLDLLFVETLMTEAVRDELKEGGPSGRFEPDPAKYPWMRVVAVKMRPEVEVQLGAASGEASVVALGLARPDVLVILDERKGRKAAADLKVRHIGTGGLVVAAKRIGRIPRARPVLEAMMKDPHGLRIGAVLFTQLLSDAGED
jgi:predicted nucleic acid-binding protein